MEPDVICDADPEPPSARPITPKDLAKVYLGKRECGVSSTRVAIELLYDRMDVVALEGGRAWASQRTSITLGRDAPAWVEAVRSSGQTLRAVVAQLGVGSAGAVVVYRSPTQSVDLASFQLRSQAQGGEAALLSVAESVPYPVDTAICAAEVVGYGGAGANRQTHVVVAAERDDVAEAIVQMVETADLKFLSATPIDATIIAQLVRQVLRYSGSLRGWLHFGECSSFLVVGGHGDVRFGRSIALGLETIAQSLTRPFRLSEKDEPVELDYGAARRILHQHGIPGSNEIVHEQLQLTRRHIMPLMQPVLQRYIIELRQSLRFALPQEERASIAITITGPGCGIPGLAELIAEELRLDVAALPQYAGYDYRVPASPGSELIEAVGDVGFLLRLNLQPRDPALRRRVGRLRRWLWTGATAALAVVGADGISFQARLGDARMEAASLDTATAGVGALQETQARLLAAIAAMDALEGTITAEVGARVSLRAILQEFSRLTPETVRLTSIRFQRNDGGMIGDVSGHAGEADPATGQTELEPFNEALKSSPLLDDVRLTSVQLDSSGPTKGQRFQLNVLAVAAPGSAQLHKIAAAEGGKQQ